MPGLIVSVSAIEGQVVERGEVLMSIEAMKMQTSVLAERDGTVKQILVTPGSKVETKDLLAIITD